VRLSGIERWISLVRLVSVPFVAFEVAVSRGGYPAGREAAAWATTAIFAVGSVVLYAVTRRPLGDRGWLRVSVAAQILETGAVASYVLVYSFELGTPTAQGLFLPLVAACVRFRMSGGIVVAVATAPVFALFEALRSDRFDDAYRWDFVMLQVGLSLLMALVVGRLVERVVAESANAQTRAAEAEMLRDELGRRSDVVDAANRCARALGSSLELDEAFGAFFRELRGLLPFDRAAIVLAEDGVAHVMATAGAGADDVFPSGSRVQLAGTLLEEVLGSSQPSYRPALEPAAYGEEKEFLELGLQSRLAAPLLVGTRAIGMLSLLRRERDAFSPAEIELAGLLGRLVATAVQNIRVYDAERRTVDELRRLSDLRSDFVALVSHELRTPLAAVFGSARTLQQRWRDLSEEQRDVLHGVIADESDRLATLVGEVLDASRIEAGAFSYSFAQIDSAGLVDEAVTAVTGHEIDVVKDIRGELPVVRGDRARLRQVLANLIDNACKYSPPGGIVSVRASAVDGSVHLDVIDQGEGIAAEDHAVIFEKFGRVRGSTKPGTGLGLYIARAIVEAHGGTLDVSSSPGRGSTFTLTLPAA
jgi:signal transduction histidine kinase